MNDFNGILKFHDNLDHQAHKRSLISQGYEKFAIISPYNDRFLPFQIRVPDLNVTTDNSYCRIKCANDESTYLTVDATYLDNNFLWEYNVQGENSFHVLYYKGNNAMPDTMEDGYYYLEISIFIGGDYYNYYSNVFKVRT